MNIVPDVFEIPRPERIAFTGSKRSLFDILLRGALLMIPTFGFYRFWLITQLRRHMWTHTEIAGDSPEYTGRGKELLIGFLVAMAILVPIYIAILLLTIAAEAYVAFAGVPLFALLYVLGQYALWRARRYRATRTTFRGIRFWMSGSGLAFVGRVVPWDLLTIVTLGLAYPWRTAALERYKFSHTHYGTLQGKFVETGWTLFRRMAWILVPAALFMITILAFIWNLEAARRAGAIGPNGQIPPEYIPHYFAALFVMWFLFAVAAIPSFIAIRLRWWLSGIRIGAASLSSDLRIRSVFGCFGMTFLAILGFSIVLGLASAALFFLVAGIVIGFDLTVGPTASGPGWIAGIVSSFVYYIILLLGLDTIRKLFLDRGIWAAAACSVTVSNIAALDEAEAAGGPAGSVGEGMLDALDMGGGF
jgi:uncharacterized membrane protein YjgN (DUF898 family)